MVACRTVAVCFVYCGFFPSFGVVGGCGVSGWRTAVCNFEGFRDFTFFGFRGPGLCCSVRVFGFGGVVWVGFLEVGGV